MKFFLLAILLFPVLVEAKTPKLNIIESRWKVFSSNTA